MTHSNDRGWEVLFAALRKKPADDAAWAMLYAALWPFLADWVVSRYGLDGDAAGDVLQDALLQYRAKLRDGAIASPSLAHVRAFVRLQALAALRARKRFAPIDDLIEMPGDPAADSLVTRLIIDEALDRLEGPCAFLLREKYITGRSSQELAEILRATDGSVRVQLHRCRERLREVLAGLARP